MRVLPAGARVAVVGAGPGGLVAAKHAIEAGFEVSVFEASDDLGGQWHTAAAHSGIWPGMRTNTSRAMTAFSDLPPPAEHELHPCAEQIHDYLRSYADAFGVTDRIRFGTRVDAARARVAGGRRAVRRGRSSRPGGSARPRVPAGPGRLHRRAAARLRLPRRRAVPRAARAGATATASAGTRSPPTSRRSRRSSPRTASRATSCRRTWTGSRRTGSGTPTSARCGGARCRPLE